MRPRPRDVVAAIGVVAGVVGFLMVARPALAASITVPRLGMIVMGILAVIEGLRSFQSRRSVDVEGAEPPDPEERVAAPLPGEDFDERVARVSQWRRGRYTADYQRTAGRYGQRATRYVAMEAGHIGENIYLQAEALGLGTVAVGAFRDEALGRVFGLPENQDALYVMPLGHRR